MYAYTQLYVCIYTHIYTVLVRVYIHMHTHMKWTYTKSIICTELPKGIPTILRGKLGTKDFKFKTELANFL